MNIAILGAPRTGKTTLVLALRQHLQTLGLHDVTVCELTAQQLTEPSRDTLALLCGLDLPDSIASSQADAELRSALARSNVSYQLVYGSGEERWRNALFAIARQWPERASLLTRSETLPRWQGVCERCSDADCEHRLFSRLLSH